MSWLSYLQWPAMVMTVIAAWLTGSTTEARRKWGFWLFLASNVVWIAWGWSIRAWAVIALQFFLAVLNIRGAKKNEPGS